MVVEEIKQEIEQDPELGPGPSRKEVVPTRSGRRRFLLDRFEDFVPSSRTAVPHVPEPVQDRGLYTPPPQSERSSLGHSNSPRTVLGLFSDFFG
jgi:hypothetical protein